MSGMLLKKAPGAFQASKIRFFRLEWDRVDYFPVEGGKCLGAVELTPTSTVTPQQATRFQVTARGGRVFDLEAQTEVSRDSWVQAVQGVIDDLRGQGTPGNVSPRFLHSLSFVVEPLSSGLPRVCACIEWNASSLLWAEW
jgi:hypothetical protein